MMVFMLSFSSWRTDTEAQLLWMGFQLPHLNSMTLFLTTVDWSRGPPTYMQPIRFVSRNLGVWTEEHRYEDPRC